MQVVQELPCSAAEQDNYSGFILGNHDCRADDNNRTICFEPERIVIMRRICGMSMRVTVPYSRYSGIGVELPNLVEDRRGFRVCLVHKDPDLSVTLYEGENPLIVDAAIAEWKEYLDLPVIGEAPPDLDNDIVPDGANAGSAIPGNRPRTRRRGGTLAKRRPRLFARRNTGDSGRMETVHVGEREIIARN